MSWFRKGDNKLKQVAEQFFQARAKKCQQLLQEAIGTVKRLPIVDPSTTPLLNLPVYDCATDFFELPCAHPDFEDKILHNDYGFNEVEDWLHRCFSEFSDPELHAFVFCRDHFVILFNQTAVPGGAVWRFVRIGDNAFHVHYWRAGMNHNAYDVDPPFPVKEIHHYPSIWVRRENDVALRIQSNSNGNANTETSRRLSVMFSFWIRCSLEWWANKVAGANEVEPCQLPRRTR